MRIVLPPYLGKTFIGDKEQRNVSQVIKNKSLFRYHTKKTLCAIVEQKLSNSLGINNVLLLVNATAALKAALLAFRPTPGGIVLIPALSYIATANACLNAGLLPICLDVDNSGHLSPSALREFLAKHQPPQAVIAVHLDGAGAQIDQIKTICIERHIPLIEDAAQSFGVKRDGKYLGTIGHIGCFSFQENKILSTGEGGAIVTDDRELFIKICAYCDHGAYRGDSIYQSWERSSGYGENYKTTEMMAAVLDAQLEHLHDLVENQRRNYALLTNLLVPVVTREPEDIPLSLWIENPEIKQEIEKKHIPYYNWAHLYLPEHPILKEKRSVYANGFPWNLNTIPKCCTTNAERISRERISVPVYPDYYQNQSHFHSLCTLVR